MILRRIAISLLFSFISILAYCQSPEISLREFASGQIKKGVRSIGMGGDGATWGNYALVWRDSGTALLDGGASAYTNHNTFSFTAVGVTTPALWRQMTVYIIALSQYSGNISTSLKSPGLGLGSVPVKGDGSNQAVFIKAAMPVGKGFSIGLLLSYERSQFSAVSIDTAANYVTYKTNWLPSGGFGLAWQNKRFLVGFRALFNQDIEKRTDKTGLSKGLNYAHEYRLGISIGLWKGALIDLGGNVRYRYNQIYKTRGLTPEPNVGFEQNFWSKRFALRAGYDESSATGGFSLRFHPIVLDVAYVYDLGMARFGNLFGTKSHSVLATFVFDYGYFIHKKNLSGH